MSFLSKFTSILHQIGAAPVALLVIRQSSSGGKKIWEKILRFEGGVEKTLKWLAQFRKELEEEKSNRFIFPDLHPITSIHVNDWLEKDCQRFFSNNVRTKIMDVTEYEVFQNNKIPFVPMQTLVDFLGKL